MQQYEETIMQKRDRLTVVDRQVSERTRHALEVLSSRLPIRPCRTDGCTAICFTVAERERGKCGYCALSRRKTLHSDDRFSMRGMS